MTAQRSTHEEQSYAKMKHDDAGKECPFCTIEVGHPQYVQETKSLKVIKTAPHIPSGIAKGCSTI
jgi:hypothetical protein